MDASSNNELQIVANTLQIALSNGTITDPHDVPFSCNTRRYRQTMTDGCTTGCATSVTVSTVG